MVTPSRIGDLTLRRDVDHADWIANGIRSFSAHVVCSHVPQGYQAYARLFHPAYRLQGGRAEVRWADVARANGRESHPAMEWASITGEWRFRDSGSQAGLWDVPPSQGSLPPRQAASLARGLGAFTSTPTDCWFAVWEGWALGEPVDRMPRIELPERRMLLLSGPLSAITTSLQPPPGNQLANMWWPEDHAWFVSSEIDLLTTYVGGTEECIDSIIADLDLEMMRVASDQSVTWDADRLNPLPSGCPQS